MFFGDSRPDKRRTITPYMIADGARKRAEPRSLSGASSSANTTSMVSAVLGVFLLADRIHTDPDGIIDAVFQATPSARVKQ